jgi:solute carrier family 25 carnitine/acylcarnitine transporter 20/29
MEHKQELGHKEPHHGIRQHPTSVDKPQDNVVEPNNNMVDVDMEQDVSFFHDFIAGGIAGSASVVVGHPMDTLKVRMQTSTGGSSMWSLATGYGGPTSLFRGMAAPLSTACVINAIIFSSYGWSSRMYDEVVGEDALSTNMIQLAHSTDALDAAVVSEAVKPIHDSSFKAFTCGSFAGLVQALVICPQEHVKCRLQIQHGIGSPDHLYKGPLQAARSIVQSHGIAGLYRGWTITCWREVPAFGAYFAFYDIFKDKINAFFAKRESAAQLQRQQTQGFDHLTGAVVSTSSSQEALPPGNMHHSHAWVSSALAGGLTGALTWVMVSKMERCLEWFCVLSHLCIYCRSSRYIPLMSSRQKYRPCP